MDLNILPECYIDTKLLKALVPPKTRYNHQKGCPNVVKQMQEKLHGDFALGIIDKDKVILKYISEFDLVCDIPDSLQLMRHPNRHHYLIFICPAPEKWIIATAERVSLSLTDFGLPHDFDKLSKITKTSKSENDDQYSDNFRQLFRALREQNPPPVAILAFWIKYLKDNPYGADLNYMRENTQMLL